MKYGLNDQAAVLNVPTGAVCPSEHLNSGFLRAVCTLKTSSANAGRNAARGSFAMTRASQGQGIYGADCDIIYCSIFTIYEKEINI